MKLLKLLSLIVIVLIAASCGGGGTKKTGSESTLKKAPSGDAYYGGVFRWNEVEYYRSLFPQNVTEVTGDHITSQVYEGLTRFNPKDLTVVPCLAENWDFDSATITYTFHLRKGVLFHNDECFPDGKGREMKAGDFEYCLTKLCTPDPNNQGFWVFEHRVKGADNYRYSREYESLKQSATHYSADSKEDDYKAIKDRMKELETKYADDIKSKPDKVAGITVVDDYTIKIQLETNFPGFLQMLALPFTRVFPKEAYDKYGTDMRDHCVGTGPFYVKQIIQDQTVLMQRNPNYWGKDVAGNQLPYLDALKVTFIKDDKTELLEFKKDNLEMKYRLPLEMIPDILDEKGNLKGDYVKFVLQTGPEMSIQYYGFLNIDPAKVFTRKEVRQAFNYAIDRDKIVNFTLKGAGYPADHGIVPLGMPGYNYDAIKGYKYDPAKAQQLLAAAGYPGGKGFPAVTLQINSGGGRNDQIAETVQKMLQDNLSITVNITKLPFAQHLENIETGQVQFWRTGWIADYPDPHNFLNLFYGGNFIEKVTEKAYINSVRFKSDKFDGFFSQALKTLDDDARTRLYEQADQVVIDEAACMPIYYDKTQRLVQPYVKGFDRNGMDNRQLREVYFVPEQ